MELGQLLTLEQALSLSRSNNLEIRNAGLEIEKADDSVDAVRTKRLPKLEVTASGRHNLISQGYTFEQGAFGDFPATGPIPSRDTTITSQNNMTGAVGASLSLPLAGQFRIDSTIEQTEIARDMAEEQFRGRQQTVEKELKNQYYSILQTQSSLQSTEESVVYYRSLLELVNRYVEEKAALKYESMEVASRLAKSEHRLFSLSNTLATEKEKLNELINRPLDTSFRVNPLPDRLVVETSPKAAAEKALLQRPDVNEARLRIQHQKLGREMKELEYLPAIEFKAGYHKLYNVNLIPNTDASVGVFARWEFYDWGRKQDEISSKTLDLIQAQNDLKIAQQRAVIEVYSRIRKLREAVDQIGVAKIGQGASREKLRVITNKYREQTVLLQDALRAESELAESNNEFNQAVLSMWMARADLEKALGED